MGEGAVLLHRGLADDPTYLHARDAACVEGLAHRAALQAPAHVAQPRGDAGDRLEERAAARRLRRHHAQVHGRAGLDEPSGGPGARDVALRARPRRGVHVGLQGEVGGLLAPVARLQRVLVAARPVDTPERVAQRHGGARRAARRRRRDRRRRGRHEGRVHQLPGLPAASRRAQPGAHGHQPRASRAGPLPRALPGHAGGRVPGGHGAAARRPGHRLAARRVGGALRPGAARPGGGRGAPSRAGGAHGRVGARVPTRCLSHGTPAVPYHGRGLAVARRARRGSVDPGHRAASSRPWRLRMGGGSRSTWRDAEGGPVMRGLEWRWRLGVLVLGSLIALPVVAATSVKPRVMLIVPFDASTLDREEQWIGEAIAQVLSLGLAQHPAFVEIERSRLRAYGQPEVWGDAALGQAARAVRADTALFGTVTRRSTELVIQPRLLDVKTTGADTVQLEPFAAPEGEQLAKIAGVPVAYARTLKVSLTPAETARIERAAMPTRSLRAFELFARGAIALQRGTQEGNETAVDLLARAIVAYQKALVFNPVNPKVYLSLGKIYYAEKGLYYESVNAYKKAIELDPQLVEARMGLGEVYEEKGLYKEAVDEYKRVIEVDSAHTGALYNMALVYEKIDPKEAMAHWERYIQLASPLQSEKDWVDVARQHLRKLKGQIKE